MAVRKAPAAKPEPAPKAPKAVEIPDNADRVASVTRNLDGSPMQSDPFVLVVEEDSSDAELAAAWNLNGELPPADQPIVYVHRTR